MSVRCSDNIKLFNPTDDTIGAPLPSTNITIDSDCADNDWVDVVLVGIVSLLWLVPVVLNVCQYPLLVRSVQMKSEIQKDLRLSHQLPAWHLHQRTHVQKQEDGRIDVSMEHTELQPERNH